MRCPLSDNMSRLFFVGTATAALAMNAAAAPDGYFAAADLHNAPVGNATENRSGSDPFSLPRGRVSEGAGTGGISADQKQTAKDTFFGSPDGMRGLGGMNDIYTRRGDNMGDVRVSVTNR